MDTHSLENRIRAIAAAAADGLGMELVHCEMIGGSKKRIVRVFIDKVDGVGHDDCAAVSTIVAEALDREDLIPAAYVLEVSSPGIERGLYSLNDFARFTGRSAKVRTKRAINGQKHFSGTIVGIENDGVVFDDRSGGKLKIPFGEVAKANLEIDFDEELKKIKKSSGK